MKNHKHMGEVTDPEYWKAMDESNIFDVWVAVRKDALNSVLKHNSDWIIDDRQVREG